MSMKKPCALCDRSRLAFVWVVAFGIIANAVYNLMYFQETISLYQIVKIPLLLCAAALFLKIYSTWRK